MIVKGLVDVFRLHVYLAFSQTLPMLCNVLPVQSIIVNNAHRISPALNAQFHTMSTKTTPAHCAHLYFRNAFPAIR